MPTVTGEQLNLAAVDVISLQHEFGLYGVWGDRFEDHLASFLDVLDKPLVTTLHSVLLDPSPSIRAAVQRIFQHSRQVVVMAERARSLLIRDYGVNERQVCVVPHGVPPVLPHGRTRIREQLGLSGRAIITTFGLVDPRKGLEYMIEAMPVISQRDPTALYLVGGRRIPSLSDARVRCTDTTSGNWCRTADCSNMLRSSTNI